jgi:hypothetical protein
LAFSDTLGVLVWNHGSRRASADKERGRPKSPSGLGPIWIKDCNEFRRWERQELVLKRASSETLAEHSKKSKMFILTARLLQGLLAGPDGTVREFRPELDGKIRQLEEAWDMIHNPMSDQEADAILKQAFPHGS